jgi:hypothetical protein
MRLLHQQPDGSLSLTKTLGPKEVPPFAILSHTWSLKEDDEVSYQDVIGNTVSTKKGYQKLLFLMARAHSDGLEYAWLDTCCMNQDSEAERSETVRTMFQWYRKASKCYVYLSDLGPQYDTSPGASAASLKAILDCRWFQRGWTVQELVAPSIVEFYSASGKYLGDKKDLRLLICLRTGIPESALQGRSMDTFTVDERLSWFDNRVTKREEDMVYASLGLFDAHMPILYGEGLANARLRLRRELDSKMAGMLLKTNHLSMTWIPC